MVVRTETRLSVKGEEAAAIVGVSLRTLERWAKKGVIPSVKIEGTRLYRMETLEAWLKAKERAGTPESEETVHGDAQP